MRPISKLESGEEWRKTLDINLQLLHVDTHVGGLVMMTLWHLWHALSRKTNGSHTPASSFWISLDIEAGETLGGADRKVGLELEPWTSLNCLAEIDSCPVQQDAPPKKKLCQPRVTNQLHLCTIAGFCSGDGASPPHDNHSYRCLASPYGLYFTISVVSHAELNYSPISKSWLERIRLEGF